VSGFFRPMAAILWKDLLLELRTRDVVASLFIFALLVVVIFNFALDPAPELVAVTAPGIVWVAFAFSGMLGLNRGFVMEKEQGTMDGLLLSPAGREAIYVGKLLASFLFMVLMEIMIYPVFAALFNLPFFLPSFIAISLASTLGFAAVGTVFSATAVNTRSRDIMLPLLLMPVTVPVFLGAVKVTGNALAGEGWAASASWFQLVAIFDILFLVVAAFLFEYVLEE